MMELSERRPHNNKSSGRHRGLLYDGRGGVQLLEQLKGSRVETLAPQESFKETTREQTVVRAALEQLVIARRDRC